MCWHSLVTCSMRRSLLGALFYEGVKCGRVRFIFVHVNVVSVRMWLEGRMEKQCWMRSYISTSSLPLRALISLLCCAESSAVEQKLVILNCHNNQREKHCRSLCVSLENVYNVQQTKMWLHSTTNMQASGDYVFLILLSGGIMKHVSSPSLSVRKEKELFSATDARFLSNNHSIRSIRSRKTFKTLAVANKCFITPGDAAGAENMMHRAAVSTHLAVRYVLHPRPGVKYGFVCSCEHVITCMSLCSYAGMMCVIFAVDTSPLSAAAAVYTEEHGVSQQLI